MEGDWENILRHARELCEFFPEGVAFIGGEAVFAHTQAHPEYLKYTAFSHDGDLVIAQADFMDLRDIEVVTTNRRLNKHEFRKNALQFDVDEEGSSGLIVPVAEILSSSRSAAGLRVAHRRHQRDDNSRQETQQEEERRSLLAATLPMRRFLRKDPTASDEKIADALGLATGAVRRMRSDLHRLPAG